MLLTEFRLSTTNKVNFLYLKVNIFSHFLGILVYLFLVDHWKTQWVYTLLSR